LQKGKYFDAKFHERPKLKFSLVQYSLAFIQWSLSNQVIHEVFISSRFLWRESRNYKWFDSRAKYWKFEVCDL